MTSLWEPLYHPVGSCLMVAALFSGKWLRATSAHTKSCNDAQNEGKDHPNQLVNLLGITQARKFTNGNLERLVVAAHSLCGCYIGASE
jgi:hypothetical protein